MSKITNEQKVNAKYFDIYEKYPLSKEEAESEEVETVDSILDAIYLKLKNASYNGANIYIEYKGERYYSLECENIDYCYGKVYKKTRIEHKEEISTPVELDIDDSTNIEVAIEKFYKTLRHPFPAEYIYVEFHGIRLFSCECFDIDYCYKTLLGKTKSEYREEERLKTQEKISYWKAEGKKYIYPDREESWNDCVETGAFGIYQGEDLNVTLELMKMLDEGKSFDEVERAIHDQDLSGNAYLLIISNILRYSKRGPAYVREKVQGVMNEPKAVRNIEKIEAENAIFEARSNGSNGNQPGDGN